MSLGFPMFCDEVVPLPTALSPLTVTEKSSHIFWLRSSDSLFAVAPGINPASVAPDSTSLCVAPSLPSSSPPVFSTLSSLPYAPPSHFIPEESPEVQVRSKFSFSFKRTWVLLASPTLLSTNSNASFTSVLFPASNSFEATVSSSEILCFKLFSFVISAADSFPRISNSPSGVFPGRDDLSMWLVLPTLSS